MEDRTSPTNEYAVRIPASFVSNARESTVVQPTPLRNLHKDFLELNEEMQVFVRIKPSKEDGSIVSIHENYVVVQPPKDSISFKNKNNAGAKTLQKFKFNKIYDPSVKQEKVFKDSALNLVQDFLMGKNTLLFTYGATSAGKTYTMLGSVKEAGLLPRSLDVVFNSLEDRLLKNPILKPLAVNEVMKLNPQQIDSEEIERSLLMRGFDLDCSDSKDSISTLSSTSLKDWNVRCRETTICGIQFPQEFFSVWVSYCEIYNEQAFDLLDSCDKKKKRTPLRITEDRKGKFYVKGLKEICVRTADDAVRVLLYGKENLHFAATKLNHNSSRSHCVFTIKVIRTNDAVEPSEAAINMMSFVDLAGMERTNKTQSRGERLKEAGNINTSLLILGRCIDAIRANQTNPQNKSMIPYRESKLTRILQTFFSGQGRAAMYVNISPSPGLCDETLHVLRFAALAQEVVMQQDVTLPDVSISQFAPPLKPSRFQQYVRKSISLLSARASVLEPSFQVIEEEDAKDRVRELEEELWKLKSGWEENEQKIRDECCNEWSEVFSRMELTWNERYEELKARYEEFCENRVDLVSQLMSNCVKKKRRMLDEEDLEDVAIKLKDKEDRIEILEDSNTRLSELVDKLKLSLKASEDARAELQQEMTKLQFEMANLKKPHMNFCGNDVIDEEMPTDDIILKLEAKLKSKDEMLNEAVLEFHLKSEELIKFQQENEILRFKNVQAAEDIANLQTQLERSNLLLSDANERLDVREEELMNLEEKLNKANGQYGHIHTELREARRKIRDLESRLKDQTNSSMISTMCEDLQRQLLEADSKLEKKDEEIQELNVQLNKYKKLIENQDKKGEELETLRERFIKSQLQLDVARKELESLKVTNDNIKARRESLLDQLSHLKKDIELSNAERNRDESDQAELRQENEHLRQIVNQMRQTQIQLLEENEDFRKTMGEYEDTIHELTKQMEILKNTQRNCGLLEEELKTLAASLGRVQLEKNQIEKEVSLSKNGNEKLLEKIQRLEEEKKESKNEVDLSRERIFNLENELQHLNEELKSYKNSSTDVRTRISFLEAELEKSKKQEETFIKENDKKIQYFESLQLKYDDLESKNEKLNKEMLRHMMRADELTETIKTMQDDINNKSHKCEILSRKINELELQVAELNTAQQALSERENSLRNLEDQHKIIQDVLATKNLVIEQLKIENAQVLSEKNSEISRLESELKALLSEQVDYKKPYPAVKIERGIENENDHDVQPHLAVTPTPVKTRKGRPKKASSPETEVDENRPELGSVSSSTRSRRTFKSDLTAPSSTSKTPGRKSRKAKTESEEAPHPALSLYPEEAESTESIGSFNSKRRLYNSKCPDVLLPTMKKEECELSEVPKRMATRSRRQ